tara:strand:+ start:2539 stop:3006 length:468 start_codon:yes stop_codon:yes gene_type:complete
MPDFNVGYPAAQAENGKFVRLTDADLASVGMTAETFGKYAILTYSVGTGNLSGQATPSTSPNSIQSIQIDTAALAVSSTGFSNPAALHYIELQNLGASEIWLSHAVPTPNDYATLSAAGIKVLAGAFYSTNHAGDLWIGADTASLDVRVIGHYSA